jgi:biotin carboxylase
MRLVVLASGNPAMERAQVAAGHEVHLVAPPNVLARPVTEGVASTRPIRHWDDYAELTELARGLPGVDAVVTCDEQAIRAAGYLTDRLGLPGPSFRQAVTATDKHVQKLRLARAGLPVARHRLARLPADVASAAEELGWPVVVKPRTGMGAVHTFFLDTTADLEDATVAGRFERSAADRSGRFTASDLLAPLSSRADGFLVEEGLKVLAEYFCDLLICDGRVLLAAPGRYSVPLIRTGAPDGDELHYDLVYSPAAAPAGITELAVRAMSALGPVSGHAHCEMLETPAGLVFGELAIRRGGAAIGDLIEAMYGVDLIAADASLALGQDLARNFEPRHAAIAAIYLTPPSGVVRAIEGADELRSWPGVLTVTMNLKVGEPTPGWFASTPLGGTILYAVRDLNLAAEEIAAVRSKLTIEVDSGL